MVLTITEWYSWVLEMVSVNEAYHAANDIIRWRRFRLIEQSERDGANRTALLEKLEAFESVNKYVARLLGNTFTSSSASTLLCQLVALGLILWQFSLQAEGRLFSMEFLTI